MSGEPQNPPLARWLEKTTAILALLGLFLYGILRVNYSIFYGNLGLTPEVMGLGYADLLTQSLAGLALIAVGLLLFMVIFFVRVIAWGLYETKSEAGKEALAVKQPSTSSRGRHIEWFVTIAIALGLLYFLVTSLYSSEGIVNPFALQAALSLILLYALRAGTYDPSPRQQELFRLVKRRYARALGVYSLIAVITVLAILPILAISDSNEVKHGRSSHFTVFGIPILSWGGDPVVMLWLEGNSPGGWDSGKSRCLIYLGQANGAAILYDVAQQHPIQLPASKVEVRLNSPDSACP